MNIKVYVLIFCFIYKNCRSYYLAYPKQADQTIKKLLDQFLDYQIIFHYDNKTQSNLDDVFIGNRSFFQTLFLVNYHQKYGLSPISNFSRPKGYKYFHVVYLKKYLDFEKFSQVHGNLKHLDLIIFIVESLFTELTRTNTFINGTSSYKIIWLKGFDKVGSIFIYDYKNNDFYYVQFYVGNLSGLVQTFPNCKSVPDLTKYINKFNDFNGHIFRVGYVAYPPWIWTETSINSKNCGTAHGIEGNFLTVLSKHLNFCFKMKDFKPLSSTPWTALINGVHTREVDWAIALISTSTERMKLVDFSTFLKIDGYGLLYASTISDFQKWDDVLKPFKISVWTLFVLMICSFSYLLQRVGLLMRHSSNLNKYQDCLMINYKAIIEQPVSAKLNCLVLRVLFSTWSLSAIIFTTVYKTNLASSMIQPILTEPESVNELLDRNYYFRVDNQDWSILRSKFQHAPDEISKRVFARCLDKIDYCNSIESLFDGKFAMIDEQIPLQYEALHTCKNLTFVKDFSKLRFTKQQIFRTVYAWPFQRGSPIQERFSKIISELRATGHFQEWFKTAYKKTIPRSNEEKVDYNAAAFKMRTFIAPALILILGYILGCIALLYEILSFQCDNS